MGISAVDTGRIPPKMAVAITELSRIRRKCGCKSGSLNTQIPRHQEIKLTSNLYAEWKDYAFIDHYKDDDQHTVRF